MLARRLPLAQACSSRTGSLALYVTRHRAPSRASSSKSPESPSRSELYTTRKLSPAQDQANQGPHAANSPQLTAFDAEATDEPKNPLSWEQYLSTEPSLVTPAEDRRQTSTVPNAGSWLSSTVKKKTNYAAVLSLFGVSRSLLESDFYRLAPQGEHLEGWAGGLLKITQARNPVTKEPLGQYFLFFDTHVAAQAYAEHLKQLRALARLAMPSAFKSLVQSSLHDHDGILASKLRAFALVPPTAGLHIARFTAQAVRDEIQQIRANEHAKLKITGRKRDDDDRARIQDAEAMLRELETLDAGAGAKARAAHHRVLVRVHGNWMMPQVLQAAIERDGFNRNLPWRLLKSCNPIVPLRNSSAEVRFALKEGQEQPETPKEGPVETAFARFLVLFADAAEARRFVRGWHKRSLEDGRTGRAMVMDATSLW